MGHAMVEAVFPYPSGLPRDVSINTFHFLTGEPTVGGTTAADLNTWILTLYNIVDGPAQVYEIGRYISEYIDRDDPYYKIYDVDTATGTMTPVAGGVHIPLTIPAALSGISMPNEVALCLTYGGVTPLIPLARQRGRVYFGPFQNELDEDGDNRPDPSERLQRDIAEAYLNCLTAELDLSVSHSVYSRVDRELYAIAGAYVDNEWDTQRRRGLPSTNRYSIARP